MFESDLGRIQSPFFMHVSLKQTECGSVWQGVGDSILRIQLPQLPKRVSRDIRVVFMALSVQHPAYALWGHKIHVLALEIIVSMLSVPLLNMLLTRSSVWSSATWHTCVHNWDQERGGSPFHTFLRWSQSFTSEKKAKRCLKPTSLTCHHSLSCITMQLVCLFCESGSISFA